MGKSFAEGYKELNKAQKEAVNTLEGPVMVVAGPGTGKTQILALRIGNILKNGCSEPDGILCLTFTNSGVSAMRRRLLDYIGNDANKINISTFHSFAMKLIEKNFELLDFEKVPEILSDQEAVFLVDEILNKNDWQYLSPRSNPAMYFSDLKQLISILKRERISAEQFLSSIEKNIEKLKDDPDNISSRGESKGKLKKETEKKIESLSRTKEVVEFYKIYEKTKKEMFLMDYDDVLEYAVFLVENFEEVKNDLQENYLYVLVDEHQDSSGIQNSFLKAVWEEVESPNIFVVGDDRQLIYAFSGASLSYFEEFSHIFGKAKLIVLTENYRSTAPILSIADNLLKSSITNEKLNSNRKGENKIMLNEYSYPRDEIIGAGLYFKEKIKEGFSPKDCALLVPKNYNVREAIQTLSLMDLPVSSGKNVSLFKALESNIFRRVLGIIINPFDATLLAKSLLDKTSGIPYLDSMSFLKKVNAEKLTIEDIINYKLGEGLLIDDSISKWGQKLKRWVNDYAGEKLEIIVNKIGNELLIETAKDNDELLKRVEVVRSFIHLAVLFEEKNKKTDLQSFLEYLDRLESYNTHIELAKFDIDEGIQVMTLHKSKGLEYECVWVAHMNEETLMSEKRGGFTLPDEIKEHVQKRDIESAKRELYVALTRAKEFCILSYAKENYNGGQMELASIIQELEDSHFIKKNAEETEADLFKIGPQVYTSVGTLPKKKELEDIKNLVNENYSEIRVSVSMLNNFFECPWKWYFRNFLRLPEARPKYLILGTVVHSVIESILNNKKLPNEDELNNMVTLGFKKEGIKDDNQIRKLEKDAVSAVSNWAKNYFDKLNPNFKSERSITYVDKENFPHLLMYGKLDLTEYLEDDEIWVTDFKTGSSKTSNQIEKIDEEGRMSDLMRQLAMYSYLLKGDNNKINISKSRLIFLEADEGDKNGLYQTRIDEEKIDLLKRDIKEYDEALLSGSWAERECHYKSYGNSKTECEYCKLAGQILANK